jgi:hypothetical protein
MQNNNKNVGEKMQYNSLMQEVGAKLAAIFAAQSEIFRSECTHQ